MSALATCALWGIRLLLGGFTAVVVWKLLTSNALKGLLSGDQYQSEIGEIGLLDFSAGRAQSLVVVVYFAVYYLIQILHSPSAFPPIPKAMLYVLGGSQATYLSGKAYDLLLARVLDDFKKGLSR